MVAEVARLRSARQQDGEDDENRDGADIDQDLRKPDELRAELQIHRSQPRKSHVSASTEWTRLRRLIAATAPATVSAAKNQ